ncbi:MAG: exosortase-associated EpsI family protein [Phycisphaeraceae bacterium]
MTRKTTLRLAAPLVALLMLGAQAAETLQRPRAVEAEPYHKMVHEKHTELPEQIGRWSGTDGEVVEAAVQLLRPNFIYNRRFVNESTGRQVSVLLVHCKDARDLDGHYPPRCYPNQGYEISQATPRDWVVDGVEIEAMEYNFSSRMFGHKNLIVHNFIIMPDGTFARDMNTVEQAAGDFTRRFYGAGQVQIVFGDRAMDPEERDAVTREMIQAHLPVIEAIRTGATP